MTDLEKRAQELADALDRDGISAIEYEGNFTDVIDVAGRKIILSALLAARTEAAQRCREIAQTANRRHGELVHPNDIADDIEREFGLE